MGKNKPFPLIRVCHWDRQSGKTQFLITDAYQRIAFDAMSAALLLSPMHAMCQEHKDRMKWVHREFYGGDDEALKVLSKRIIYVPDYYLTKKEGKVVFPTEIKRLFVYCDEVDYMASSIESLMLALHKLKKGTGIEIWSVTFTATPADRSKSERARALVRTDRELVDLMLSQQKERRGGG